jgi:broad specificity phosphatase PhoE
VLLRHGQTDFNLKGIVHGSGVNSPLNEFGKKQADLFYSAYRDYGFDQLFTSALQRTHQTVQAFIDAKMPWQVLPDLNEISWGKHEGQPITPEEDKYYQWMLRQWQLGNTTHKIDGGESPDDVAGRLTRALDVIKTTESQKSLVCMHGRAMRIMLCLMLNYPLRSMDVFEHKNACVYELQFTGSSFHVLKHNDTNHLKGLSQ